MEEIEIVKIIYLKHKINGNCFNFDYLINNDIVSGQYYIDEKKLGMHHIPLGTNAKEYDEKLLYSLKKKLKEISKFIDII